MFNQTSKKQYDMLVKFSRNNDIESWNEWRRNNNKKEILLKGADLSELNLEGISLWNVNLEEVNLSNSNLKGAFLDSSNMKGANLSKADFSGASLHHVNFDNANLEYAVFYDANLKSAHFSKETKFSGTDFGKAFLKYAIFEECWLEGNNFECAVLEYAHFNKAYLVASNFKNTNLGGADCRGTNFTACLSGANLEYARLDEANLQGADIENANFQYANLENANIDSANLIDANFERAIVNASTSMWGCKVSRNTNFYGVALDSISIEPSIKELLEYNIRRTNWEKWYKDIHFWKRVPVQIFWHMSDYGHSSTRIFAYFFSLVFSFAIIYYLWGLLSPPGVIMNLFQIGNESIPSNFLVFWRAVYFSIVTMTTLGFGDMYANPQNLLGHLLLITQVLFGYVILGALLTRLSILFTSGGPSGKFTIKQKHQSKK